MALAIQNTARRRLRKAGWAAALFFGACLTVLAGHRFWLPWFGSFLILQHPLQTAELVIVSTGSYPRFVYAAELMRRGFGKKMLIVGDRRSTLAGDANPVLDIALAEALAAGIAREDLIVEHSTSTRDDARLARRTMEQYGYRSGLVVSDKFNMRRLAWVFDRVFAETAWHMYYVFPGQEKPGAGSAGRWWEDPNTFMYVVKEWIKLPVNWFQERVVS
jgi:uncharacterized SAM-binding protein YcdF (DUF218 family)